MRERFTLNVMDKAHYFLGMKITRDRRKRKIWLSQAAYVKNIIQRFQMEGSSSTVPMRYGLRLEKVNGCETNRVSSIPYREVVGSLMYLACTTRPDIMFATSYLARYSSCYGEEHWAAAK